MTPENADAICRICRGVDGLPLGIELTAHWVTLFTPAEIADAVERQLNFLVTPHSDVEERHRSMRNVFNHSWALLNEDEQRALAAASIFQHIFDRRAIQAVAGCDLATVQGLINRHLLRIVSPGRDSLHPLLKRFAAEKQVSDGEFNAAVEKRTCRAA